MSLTESEKRLAYQIELTNQIGTLHEVRYNIFRK